MTRVAHASLVLALLLAAAQTANAQRLRVTMAGTTTQTIGTLHSATDTSLVLATETGLFSFSARNISRLEQSAGRRPNLALGAVGLLLGAGIGGVLGCAANSDSYGVFCGGQDDTKVIVGAVAGGVAGGLVGALLFKTERWESFRLGGVPQP